MILVALVLGPQRTGVFSRLDVDPRVTTLDRDDIIHYRPINKVDGPAVALPLHNENQRFYYVPRMRPDEVLIIKQLDTRAGKAMVAPHTSFVDPTSPSDAPERTSIDIRFLCVFPKG